MSSPRVDVDGVSVSPDHYINGERIASSRTFEDRSPLDWTWKLADVARASSVEADLAVSAAEAAFPAWAALSVDERGAYLDRLADLIDRDVASIAHVECLDMAMLEESLKLRVIGRGARNFRAYADLARSYEPRRWSSNGTANTVLRMPAGPTVVITPWNAPFMLSTWKCAPALAAGNTVVLKPAEWSPLSCSMLMDLVDEAGFAPGVFNVVQGFGSEVGAALVSDPRVRRISFTGSPETGRFIGEAAANNLVPFTAELGGKGPFIVFADADLDAAAEKAAVMYDDGGQVCLAGTRLLVEDSVRDAFVERFESRHQAPRARRQPRVRDHDLATHPPRSPRARRGIRQARQGERRPGGLRRREADQGRALVRTDAHRAGLERRRDRPARGLRSRPDDPELRRREPRPPNSRTPPPTGFRRSSTPPAKSAPSDSAPRFAPGPSGSTASSCATSVRPSAAPASVASAARAATTRWTSIRI